MASMFELMKVSNDLTNYLSREKYNVMKMEENSRVSESLFHKKVEHYNELVGIMNPLFSKLLKMGPDDVLFEPITLGNKELEAHAEDNGYSDEIPILDLDDEDEDEDVEYISDEDTIIVSDDELPAYNADTGEIMPEPYESEGLKAWQLEEYESYDTWLEDKQRERSLLPDDMSSNTDAVMSKRTMTEALDDYEKDAVHEVSSYDPESGVDVDVLPKSYSLDEDDEELDSDKEDVDVLPKSYGRNYGSDDISYINKTADNQDVDSNPIQIADVRTAVEFEVDSDEPSFDIDIDTGSRRFTTDITHFDLISDEIEKQYVNKDSDDDEDVQEDVEDEVSDVSEPEEEPEEEVVDNHDGESEHEDSVIIEDSEFDMDSGSAFDDDTISSEDDEDKDRNKEAIVDIDEEDIIDLDAEDESVIDMDDED